MSRHPRRDTTAASSRTQVRRKRVGKPPSAGPLRRPRVDGPRSACIHFAAALTTATMPASIGTGDSAHESTTIAKRTLDLRGRFAGTMAESRLPGVAHQPERNPAAGLSPSICPLTYEGGRQAGRAGEGSPRPLERPFAG
jgi:hypothetical protein